MLARSTVSVVLLGLLALVIAAPAAAEDDRWTPALSMKYHRVGPVAISPDGTLVAFAVTAPLMEGEKSEYRTQVHVVPAAGGDAVAYTTGENSATSPAFSPDGRHLAFLRKGEENQQVWLLPLAGGEAYQATHAENGARSFRFSPDGFSIGYLMTDPETEEEKTRKKEKRDVELVDQDFKYGHLYVTLVSDRYDPDGEDRRLTRATITSRAGTGRAATASSSATRTIRASTRTGARGTFRSSTWGTERSTCCTRGTGSRARRGSLPTARRSRSGPRATSRSPSGWVTCT